MSNGIKSENPVPYGSANIDNVSDDAIITRALAILGGRLCYPGGSMTTPESVKAYLKLKLAEQEREVFAVLFLDNRHRSIGYDELFYGTIDGATVHPREVVKAALKHNAAAVILSHNHPSGEPEPSTADINITTRLSKALELVDVRVLDHIVVGGVSSVSFAERGLI